MNKLKPIITVIFVWSFLLISFACLADEKPADNKYKFSNPDLVLELFTSQGCSSCPEANEFVREMAKEAEVLALSYSVDYWDYLGWKDTFGKAEFTKRQMEYGRKLGGEVYTPQIIVNGNMHSNRMSRDELAKYKLANRPKIMPEFKRKNSDNKIKITFEDPIKQMSNVFIMAVYYKNGAEKIAVKSGENKGRVLHLTNIVKVCQQIEWDKNGKGFEINPPKQGQSVAILLQTEQGGKVLSALKITPYD